jgi:hypothetical protein
MDIKKSHVGRASARLFDGELIEKAASPTDINIAMNEKREEV